MTLSRQQLSHLEEMSIGGTKVIEEGTRGRFCSGITTCPHCVDPDRKPKQNFPLNEQRAGGTVKLVNKLLLQSPLMYNSDL